MKKTLLPAAIIGTAFTLTSCFGSGLNNTTSTTTGSTSTTSTTESVISAGASILNDLLGGLLSKTLTERSFIGTWTYQAPEVRFESESLLSQAGGSVMASTIEKKLDSYLTKVGITKGVTTFTFNSDKTYSIQSKDKIISSGTYSYDQSSQTLHMQGTFGLLNQDCIVGMDGMNLCLLYDADKLLTVISSAASILGQVNGTLDSVASVFGNNYKGMKVGYSLSK